MMFAVLKTGGKQYRVKTGDIIEVEKLDGEQGNTLNFEEVLMVNDGKKTTLGTPFVKDANVSAEILEQGRAPKIIVFKKKRRKDYRRKKGHRQELTTLKITDFTAPGMTAPKKATAPAKESPTETPKKEAVADGA